MKVAGEVAWAEASPDSAPDRANEELKVAPGDIVRFATEVPVRAAEVVTTEEGEAALWQTLVPENGSAMIRAGLFTTAVRASHDAFRGVHQGAARKPEFAWFELEDDAVDWGKSDLGTPFPKLADAERFDPAGFADLDEALGAAYPKASRTGEALDVITAIRTAVALRAVHTLEGLRGFPYALNRDIDLPTKGAPRVIETRKYVLAEPGHGIPVTASGPVELFVWARVARTKGDADVEVVVTEAGRVRGSTRGLVRREVDRELPEGSELSQLRHIIVHVPPGEHSYTIEPLGSAAWVSAELSHPAARLEHVFSSTWREERLLSRAKKACEPESFSAACALALALSAEEGRPEFARALAAGGDAEKRATETLARGGEPDYAATLESRAMLGDVDAENELARQARDTVDQSMHDAWKRVTLRATHWEPVPGGGEPRKEDAKWLTFVPAKKPNAACDDGAGLGSRREIGQAAGTFRTTVWRRGHALDLVTIAPCSGEPIQLEVDGQTVVAQPSQPRSLWHVVVRGETASVRRLDHGGGHVYAMGDDECSSSVETTTAPDRLDSPRTLSFPEGAPSVGLEIWGAASQPNPRVTVRAVSGSGSLVIEAKPKLGDRGIDGRGQMWARAGRVPLPDWAKAGVVVEGDGGTAVRALVRRARASSPSGAVEMGAAVPPDEGALMELGRRIRAATDPGVRAGLLSQRALLLASYGDRAAALLDAGEAVRLGGASVGDLVERVDRSIRPAPAKEAKLPVAAYGLEPDFDAGAARCVAPAATSPRHEIGVLEAILRARPPDAPFDRELALRTVRALSASPGDPRADSLERLALRGSTWHLSREATSGAGRVARPYASARDKLFDPEGRLRPDVLLGHPVGANYVTVTQETPARAIVGGPKTRLDVVCISQAHFTANDPCPFTYALGNEKPKALSLAPGELTQVDIPSGRRTTLTLSVPKSDADFAAIVRMVFDQQVEGTVHVPDVGWVLETPHVQHRTLVTPTRSVHLDVKQEDIVRVDARSEPGAAATVFAAAGGHEVSVPLDGEPVILAVPAGTSLVVGTHSGEATIAVAERIVTDAKPPPAKAPPKAGAVATGDVTLDFSRGRWQEVARRSPRPLSWLEDRLGTVEADTGVTAASLHEGSTTATGVDAYFYEDLTYQRRIEWPNLYTVVGAAARIRSGPSTYAAEAGFYEDLDRYRTRITGTATGFTQTLNDTTVYTLQANGFLEYSGRIRPDFFILPRLGYDGFYTNLGAPPPSTVNVDDDVYDPFRYVRNTLVFLQALIWYCPHFNDIYYIRLRADYDVTNNTFSHASVLLPGILLIFHQAEMSFFVDGEYFAATPGPTPGSTPVRPTAGVDVNGGGQLIWHTVILPGSFELRPQITTTVRANDLSWSVSAGVNILAAFRRGQRDYSSLELSFPEETAGGVPWREETRVGP